MHLKIIFFLLVILVTSAIHAQEININKATAIEIASNLEGIGIKKAKDIVQYRNDNGDFKDIKELIKIKGIGDKTISKNEKNIRFK